MYKATYRGEGCKTVIKSDGVNSEYTVADKNDTFVLKESDAGIYVEVTLRMGSLTCVERLYGMNRDDPEFWLYERQWSGEGHNPKATYLRDKRYPVGKQVLIGTRKPKADPVEQIHHPVS